MKMCDQCRTCDALDGDQNGLYCMISSPKPVIRDGMCSSYHPERGKATPSLSLSLEETDAYIGEVRKKTRKRSENS